MRTGARRRERRDVGCEVWIDEESLTCDTNRSDELE
jgi:hypothetical protein